MAGAGAVIGAIIIAVGICLASAAIEHGLHAIARAIEKLCEKIDDIE